jgi:hypothetical protein
VFAYNDDQEWGTSFEYTLEDTNIKSQVINFIFDFKLINDQKEVPFVFTVERNGESIIWEAQDINFYSFKRNKWSRAYLTYALKNLQAGDKIKSYFWNKNRMSFQVDNLQVNFEQ